MPPHAAPAARTASYPVARTPAGESLRGISDHTWTTRHGKADTPSRVSPARRARARLWTAATNWSGDGGGLCRAAATKATAPVRGAHPVRRPGLAPKAAVRTSPVAVVVLVPSSRPRPVGLVPSSRPRPVGLVPSSRPRPVGLRLARGPHRTARPAGRCGRAGSATAAQAERHLRQREVPSRSTATPTAVARDAVEERTVYGVVVATAAEGPDPLTTSAASPFAAQLLKQAAAAEDAGSGPWTWWPRPRKTHGARP